MKDNSISDFPTIEAAYTDEFGEVDPDVYEVAKEIWSPAKSFALRLLRDSDTGLDLLLEAVVKVSRVRKTDEIENPRAYLFITYKRLVLAEQKKERGRKQLLETQFPTENLRNETETELNKKILINELRCRMDDWTREVFDLLQLGYTYEELVPDFGSAANVIRSKYSKRSSRLAKEIQAEMKLTDDKINFS